MLDFSKGYSFEEYLEKGYAEERDRQVRACSRTRFSQSFEGLVRSVKRTLCLAAFAEVYCPDSVVFMPFARRMTELSKAIGLTVFPRTSNEKLLEELTGVARVPTLLFCGKEGIPSGSYVELPRVLREEMRDLDAEERSALVIDYRRGRYNEMIEAELSELLSPYVV